MISSQDCKNYSFDSTTSVDSSDNNLNYECFSRLLDYLSQFLHFSNANLFIIKSDHLKLLFSYPFLQHSSDKKKLYLPKQILENLAEVNGLKIFNFSDHLKDLYRFCKIQTDSSLMIAPITNGEINLGALILFNFGGSVK